MDDQQAEKFYRVVAEVARLSGRPQDEAKIAAWLSDETDADDIEALTANYIEYADQDQDEEE